LENINRCMGSIKYVLFEYHSEKDSRIIDNILNGFHIVTAKATSFDLGQIKYINSRLISRLHLKSFNPTLPLIKILKSFPVQLLEFSKKYNYIPIKYQLIFCTEVLLGEYSRNHRAFFHPKMKASLTDVLSVKPAFTVEDLNYWLSMVGENISYYLNQGL
jgi:hypothetical protein